jgi:hypothetical protein
VVVQNLVLVGLLHILRIFVFILKDLKARLLQRHSAVLTLVRHWLVDCLLKEFDLVKVFSNFVYLVRLRLGAVLWLVIVAKLRHLSVARLADSDALFQVLRRRVMLGHCGKLWRRVKLHQYVLQVRVVLSVLFQRNIWFRVHQV